MELQPLIHDRFFLTIGKDSLPIRLAFRLRLWQQRRRTRLHLAQLPDYLLKDIGLERHDVLLESAKPFWR
jgi:uncharacterized protein YjiS (DUF1127 family)